MKIRVSDKGPGNSIKRILVGFIDSDTGTPIMTRLKISMN